jgi:transposase-like protein
MAETKRMTSEQVVGYLLEGEGLDFLRESLSWVVQQLMEAEVSELVGAARGERVPEERLTQRNGYRARLGRRGRASSSWRSRSCAAAATFPASSSRAAAASRRW